MGDKERLQASLSRLRGTATPRPEWSRCQDYVEGWEEARVGRSSNQLVDLLLARLSGRTLEEVTALSSFQGQVRVCNTLVNNETSENDTALQMKL